MYVAVAPIANSAADSARRRSISRFFAAIQAGDHQVLMEVLSPNAVTRWPQSGERVTGALSCVQIYENYPGGPPHYRLDRISGCGDTWVAELVAEYGEERWHVVSVIEFDGSRINRMTDYFGPSFPAPEWRKKWLDPADGQA